MTVATPATTITLPTDTVTLDATTSDPDSGPNPLTYAWSTVSAPSSGTVTFGTPTAEDTSTTFNVAGSYTLRLTADDSADPATSDITITVNPEPPAVSTRVNYSIAGQSVAVANNGTLTWILGDNQGSTSTVLTAGQATTVRYHPYGTQRGTPASLPATEETAVALDRPVLVGDLLALDGYEVSGPVPVLEPEDVIRVRSSDNYLGFGVEGNVFSGADRLECDGGRPD